MLRTSAKKGTNPGDNAIARLSGGFAHDLKNLLTPILAYGDMVKMEVRDSAAGREYVAEIVKSGERTLALADRIQALNAQRSKLQSVRIGDLVQATAAMLQQEIVGTHILHVETSHNTGTVRADPKFFDRILRELVQNARDAMPAGGRVRIGVALRQIKDPTDDGIPGGDFAVLSVKDEGSGIAPDIMPRLFEPYFTTKEKAPGRGLGLASVLEMVQQCEGYVQIESNPGRGTDVRIFLPHETSA